MIYQKSWRNLECLVNRYVRLTLFILCCFQFVGCENRGFTENARADVVERERQKLVSLEEQKGRLEEKLQALSDTI